MGRITPCLGGAQIEGDELAIGGLGSRTVQGLVEAEPQHLERTEIERLQLTAECSPANWVSSTGSRALTACSMRTMSSIERER